MPTPTHADAELILKLYELRQEPTLRKARRFMTLEFFPETFEDVKKVANTFGTEENAFFRQATSYWDMAAGFVVQGVLNENLFLVGLGEPFLIYGKLRPFLAELRQAVSFDEYLQTLEQFCTGSEKARDRLAWIERRLEMRRQTLKAQTAKQS